MGVPSWHNTWYNTSTHASCDNSDKSHLCASLLRFFAAQFGSEAADSSPCC